MRWQSIQHWYGSTHTWVACNRHDGCSFCLQPFVELTHEQHVVQLALTLQEPAQHNTSQHQHVMAEHRARIPACEHCLLAVLRVEAQLKDTSTKLACR
jgi:hypothetical protein